MKLKKLLKDISIKAIKGSKEINISGICANSKVVAPGNLFIAKRGRSEDGNRFIPEAIAGGAVAILTDIFNPTLKNIVQLIHPENAKEPFQEIEGALAANYYEHPSQNLFLVGITGTNGKTTTSYLIKHLLDSLQIPTGLIGTIEHVVGQHRYQAVRTTPDVTTNHKMLREMVLQGCKAAVMEVTSHGLDQGRVAQIEFDVGVFTNLSVDHLDYHVTMDDYCKAKQLLFKSLKKGKKNTKKWAVVNADSPWSPQILENCPAEILTYGIESPANLRAINLKLTALGTSFELIYQEKQLSCHLPLVGRFNVYNALAAIEAVLTRGLPLEEIVPRLASFGSVPGRLEPVPNTLGLKIFVDFAHSDDALKSVLETLKEFKTGRIITVFGCGGDRDRTKRPKMARVVEQYSDVIMVTSDNPRSEDPSAICQEIIAGFQSNAHYKIELDRKAAIAMAVEIAEKEDIVLIAGKGHEKYQIFAHQTIEFDDRKVASDSCAQKALNPSKSHHV